MVGRATAHETVHVEQSKRKIRSHAIHRLSQLVFLCLLVVLGTLVLPELHRVVAHQ